MAGSNIPPQTGPASNYTSGDGRRVRVNTSMGILFSDDFGGTAINATNWTVIPGGYGTIGSGTDTSMTYSVSASALTVNMNTTSGDELWFLSNQVFAGAEDLLITLSRSQALAANSIFIGLVEVDQSGNPLVNPNLANDFTNRGGTEFGATTGASTYVAQAVADSSNAAATGSSGISNSVMTTLQEFIMEFHAEDIIVSSQAVDNAASKSSNVSRVSSQCPNDQKQYKLLLRFRNTATPASNTVITIGRVLVADCQEQRVEVTSGRGDLNAQKAIAVNVVSNLASLASSINVIGAVYAVPTNIYGANALANFRLSSAATTNATSVKTSSGNTFGGQAVNTGTTVAYLKFYNKASAPTVGTDTPVITMFLPAQASGTNAVPINLAEFFSIYGYRFGTGIALAITGAYADTDTTAIAAGQVTLNLMYF